MNSAWNANTHNSIRKIVTNVFIFFCYPNRDLAHRDGLRVPCRLVVGPPTARH